MAVVTRYFGVTGTGAADGTTWADRAASIATGAISTVISGFNFAGTDSLLCYFGPGNHSGLTTSIAAASFANPPTAANPLWIHGCDSSGNAISPPDPDWTSDQADWSDTTLPVIATTTNIRTINLGGATAPTCFIRMMKFTGSGNQQSMFAGVAFDWCHVISTKADASTYAIGGCRALNCVLKCTGSSYAAVVDNQAGATFENCRVVGVTGSSGNRHGVILSSSANIHISRLTSINNGGSGIAWTAGSAGVLYLDRSVIANNGATGILLNSTASQTVVNRISGCMVTGNGTAGIDANGARVCAVNNRLRDNTSNFANFGNYPTDFNYTTDSDDATEYVNSASGDYRIKNGSAIWDQGYGVSSRGGGMITHPGMAGGLRG